MEDRVRTIFDSPASQFIGTHPGTEPCPGTGDDGQEFVVFEDDAALAEPYLDAFKQIVWKPTAICVNGDYMTAYSEETDSILQSFPTISESEAPLLVDLLSKIFTREPSKRPSVQQLVTHPWFHAVVTPE